MIWYAAQVKATKAELAYMAQVKEMPCCHCVDQRTPTQVHHIVRDNKRLGHMFCLPLCVLCHERVSKFRHREKGLHFKVREQLGMAAEWPSSKIVARRT